MSYTRSQGGSAGKTMALSAIFSCDNPMDSNAAGGKYAINCKWDSFRGDLLRQWSRLTEREIDEAGPDRIGIARLIHRHYGMSVKMVENYLRNFERMMPLA